MNLGQFFVSLKNHKVRTLIIAGVIIAGGYFGWTTFGPKQSNQTYQTAAVGKGTVVSTVTASGLITSGNMVNVTTQASGVVKNVFVKVGDQVTAGQKIAEITLDRDSQQKNAAAYTSYLSAKNSLASSQAALFSLQSSLFTKWKTYMDLAQSASYQNADNSPRLDQRQLPQFYSVYDDWLKVQADYQNQQGVIAQAQSSLNSSWLSYQQNAPVITAPTAGTINNLIVAPGVQLASTQSNSSTSTQTTNDVGTIRVSNNVQALVNLSEIDGPKVKSGQSVTLTLDSQPGKTFTGKVVNIDTSGVVSSGVTNYPATIAFDTAPESILPNMSVTANIIIQVDNDVLSVPSTAVQTSNGQAYVSVLKNGQLTQVPVEVGISSDSQTEITSGLNEGDQVVTSTITTSSQTSSGSSPFSRQIRVGGVGGGGFGGGR